MTPKEKAKQLVESMSFTCRECDYEEKAKQCALIASVECIKSFGEMGNIMALWWIEVNKEIKKL